MFTNTNFITNNYTKFLQFKLIILLSTLISILLMGCSDTSGGDGAKQPVLFTATNLPIDSTTVYNIKIDEKRVHHITFSIATTADGVPGTYRIGVRATESTLGAPTAANLVNDKAAFTRTLGTTAINMYIASHIDGTLFDGTNTLAAAKATMLAASTKYTVYVTKANGTEPVYAVLTVTTDAPRTETGIMYGFPASTPVFTFRAGDPQLLYTITSNGKLFTFNVNNNLITAVTYNNASPFPNPSVSVFKMFGEARTSETFFIIGFNPTYTPTDTATDKTDSFNVTDGQDINMTFTTVP